MAWTSSLHGCDILPYPIGPAIAHVGLGMGLLIKNPPPLTLGCWCQLPNWLKLQKNSGSLLLLCSGKSILQLVLWYNYKLKFKRQAYYWFFLEILKSRKCRINKEKLEKWKKEWEEETVVGTKEKEDIFRIELSPLYLLVYTDKSLKS